MDMELNHLMVSPHSRAIGKSRVPLHCYNSQVDFRAPSMAQIELFIHLLLLKPNNYVQTNDCYQIRLLILDSNT